MKIFPSVLFAALCASALCETYALEVESTPPAQATDKQEKGKSDRSHRVVVVPGTSTSLEAICLGVDDLAHLYTQESNGAWHAADVLPNPTASPFCAVVASQDSSKIPRVIVLGRDDGQPGVLKRLPQGGWSAVEPLPNPSKMAFSAVATTAGPNGQCQVICLGRKDGQPYLFTQDPATGTWAFVGSLTNPRKTAFSVITIGALSQGRIPAVLIGRDDGQPYLVWQQKDGTWGAVELILHFKHAPLSAVAPAVGTDGYLQVICVGRDDGQPYLIWQDAVNGTWNDYGVLANPEHLLFSSVVTGVGNQDMIQAILLTRDSGLPYHLWHNHQGKWSQAWALPDFHRTPFSALATGNAANTALQVICLGRDDGRPYFFSQDPTFASWPVSRKLNEPLQQQVAVPPVGGGQNKPDF